MAMLESASTTIEILPCKRETPNGTWINTRLAIEYHIQDQAIRFELPLEGVSIETKDFDRLISGTRKYIEELPQWPIIAGSNLDTYRFSPLEPTFNIKFGSGFYLEEDRKEGVVWMDFEMGLRALGINDLSADYIGCNVAVQTNNLLRFLDTLEQEIEAI